MGVRTYDDASFGVVERVWFGRPPKMGGTDAAFTVGSATALTHVVRYYPRGPIEVVKTGAFVTTAVSTADNATGSSGRERIPFRLSKSAAGAAGASQTTSIATWNMQIGDSARQATFTAASTVTIASKTVESGRFLTIRTGSGVTDGGTMSKVAAGTVLNSGSFAVFVDYKRKYGTQWDV